MGSLSPVMTRYRQASTDQTVPGRNPGGATGIDLPETAVLSSIDSGVESEAARSSEGGSNLAMVDA